MPSIADSAVHAPDVELAKLGHDLRNVLNAMGAALAVLELSAPGSAQSADAQRVLARQLARLGTIVDERLPMR